MAILDEICYKTVKLEFFYHRHIPLFSSYEIVQKSDKLEFFIKGLLSIESLYKREVLRCSDETTEVVFHQRPRVPFLAL